MPLSGTDRERDSDANTISTAFHEPPFRCTNEGWGEFDMTIDLYAYMLEHRRRAVSRPGAIAKSCRDHAAIVAALRAHDANAVVAAFDHHLTRIYRTTRSILESEARASGLPAGLAPLGSNAD